MLFPRIKRTDPEKIFGVFQNQDTVPLVSGDVVRLRLVADSVSAVLGVEMIGCTAATDVPLGVISGKDIQVADYGYCQVYGYHSNVKGITAGTAKAAQVTSATAKTCTDSADANYDPKLTIGYCVKALASGRTGVFLKCM